MTEQPIPDDAEAWRPLQSPEEREALVLEFQRLAARLFQAQLISTTTSSRLVRSMSLACRPGGAATRLGKRGMGRLKRKPWP